ncbi:MAG: hypothetical protein IKW80_08635, partial [Thermoguttaceae bacterium]|nr:hypothetical protein [Thermoguttaceae bacterium]
DVDVSAPFRGLNQWTTFLDSLDETSVTNRLPNGTASISATLSHVLTRWQRKGLVLVFSDFFDAPESVESALKRLRAMGHDCRVYQVLDRDELTFPFNNRTRFVDLESDARGLDAEPLQIKAAYLEALERHLSAIRSICNALEIKYRLAPTDVPIEQILRGGGTQ